MAKPAPPLRALLVGIDRYPAAGGGFGYPSLYGAVGDVARIEEYLRQSLGVPAERITRLIAPHIGGDPAEQPTHANLVAALARLETEGRPDEQVLVYYSGHGGRTPTLLPTIKGAGGIDEVLAPADVADPAVPYLRDVEIAAWLARCAARGLFVTLILDCCHSGGAVRKNRRVRGSERVDRTPRPTDRLLASREEMAAVWRQTPLGGAAAGLARLPAPAQAPRGFALLAACRPHERAVELDLGGEWQGVMTRALLAALRRADGPGMTYRRLHSALTTRLHAEGYVGQTPVVDGEADRPVFGRRELAARCGVEVLEVEGWPGERLRLATGRLHGTRRGERFALFAAGDGSGAAGSGDEPPDRPPSDAEVAGIGGGAGGAVVFDERLGTAEVTELGSTASWARPDPRLNGVRAPRAGDRAILVDPGPLALQRGVAWSSDREGSGEDRYGWLSALLAAHGDGCLAAAPPGISADFEVVETGGLLELRDAGGNPIPHHGPPLPLIAPGTARELVRRLAHLARHWNVRALENPDPTATLAGVLRMRIEPLADPAPGVAPTRDGACPAAEPFMVRLVAGGLPAVPAGARLRLSLENRGPRAFNLAVLDLAPDWGIRQIVPHRHAAPWTTLEPGLPLEVELIASLPRGLDTGVDVLKAIACTAPFDVSSIERPPLHPSDRASRSSGRHSGPNPAPTDPFGRLLAALGAERTPNRVLRTAELAPGSWTTAQVEVWVVRRGESGSAAPLVYEESSQ